MPGEARNRGPDSGRLAPGEDPGRWEDQTLTQWIRRLERPADWPAHGTLRGLLLDEPDLLAAEWADNCLRADSGAIITRWWESPPPTARFAGVASGNG